MSTPRLATIDGLRGLAVMGIVLMNVADFALPSGAYFNPAATGTPSAADLAIWAATFVLVDGKMRALFSILFGASTAIVVDRAIARGADPVRVHLARMATLALFGLAHWVLVWPGDILLHYAIVGALALPFTQMTPRQQIRIAVLLIVAQAAIQGIVIADELSLRAAVAAPGASAAAQAAWRAFSTGVGIGPAAAVQAQIATMRGGWPGIAAANLTQLAGGVPFLLAFDGPETLAYMLIGMAALSSGFLGGGWRPRACRRLAAATLGIGLPLSAVLAWAAARSGFETIATFAAATLGGVPLRAPIALGYAALAIPRLAGGGRGVARVRAAGRMAFTNYLATSVALAALFDGWGLGLFARLSRTEATLLVLPVAAAMLGWSAPWLARHRYGPLEWLWRSLARGRWQSNKAIETVYQ